MIILNIIEGYFNLLRFIFFKKYREKQKELFNKRLNICKNCEYLGKNTYCSICGCLIKVKTKVIYKLNEEEKSINGCPKKYW